MTAVPPTHGTSTVEEDASLAGATLNTPTVPPVTCCQVSVPVSLVLEARHARSAGNCFGVTLKLNAMHVTVTQEASPLSSVIKHQVTAFA